MTWKLISIAKGIIMTENSGANPGPSRPRSVLVREAVNSLSREGSSSTLLKPMVTPEAKAGDYPLEFCPIGRMEGYR